ncbi:TonB-dependent receptor domain-containing protein [Sphingosinicella sp.]|uniref:TonB-dependent receptor domain-containing protein n=1 Tax=Sphingosinicella sp. TaxID=1917971 RepID=UPI0040383448
MRQSSVRTRFLASTIIASAAFAAAPAFAQNTAQTAESGDDQAIVVTGTLVRNPNLVASSPINSVGEQEIELQQANVAEELLRELPGAVPSVGSAVNNGNGGSSFVNLRGLGANRNVVLIDGVRLVPANLLGQFDLNNIPLALIQRVDVLTGGASTTYGADAVSGVVNFITRRDFAGIDINLSEQITERGDGNIFRADVTIGANFDDGRGNATLSVGYQEADPVYQGARGFSIFGVDTFTGAVGGSGTAVPSRFTGVNTLGPCGGPGEPTCAAAQGNRQLNDAGTAFQPTAAFTPFNFNPYNIFQTPFERFNIYASANYQISDAIEIYTRGLFSKNTVDTIIAPSGAFGLQVTVPLSSPFLTPALRNAFCAFDTNTGAPYVPLYTPAQCTAAATALTPADPNFRTVTTILSRRAVEVGPRISSFGTTIFDYRLGARGGITDSIDWDLFGSYGESDVLATVSGFTLNSRVRAAAYATNAATCLPNAPLGGSTTPGCVPINFFGPAGNATWTPAAIDYLTDSSTVLVAVTLAQARGTVSGDFGWSLPWASQPVSFAVGGEFREYTASQRSDSLAQSGDLGGAGGAAPNINGGFNVYEAFGELIVPIISERPFFDLLELRGGIRYSSYGVDAPGSPSYNTTTWKVEGTWAPIDGLRFRGSYSRAIRAPSIFELFTPVNTVLTNLNDDPCANLQDNGNPIPGRPVPTGQLLAICLAQGAPAGAIGAIGVPTAGQANVTVGGNLNVQPEKSTSWTVGVVFQPDFIPGLSLSADYYNIRITDAITVPTPGDAIESCFGPLAANGQATAIPAGAAASAACTGIRRNPTTGQLSGDPATTPGLALALSNLGILETSGVDFVLNYRRNLDILGGMGLAFNFVLNWTDESLFQAVSGVSVNRECVGFYSVNCASIQPEWQWSLRTTFTFDNIDISLLWRHIDAVSYEPGQGNPFTGTLGAGLGDLSGQAVDFDRIPSADYFDLTGRIAVDDHLTITLSVQNLLDRAPPVVGSSAGSTAFNSGNTYPSTYDALGRRFVASARIRF